jgi:hypothetical protein
MKGEIKNYLRTIGSHGGKASADRLTAKQRTARARKAGLARGRKAAARMKAAQKAGA